MGKLDLSHLKNTPRKGINLPQSEIQKALDNVKAKEEELNKIEKRTGKHLRKVSRIKENNEERIKEAKKEIPSTWEERLDLTIQLESLEPQARLFLSMLIEDLESSPSKTKTYLNKHLKERFGLKENSIKKYLLILKDGFIDVSNTNPHSGRPSRKFRVITFKEDLASVKRHLESIIE